MSNRIILTGVTGNAGSALLSEALASPHISHVTVLSRRPPLEPNTSHPKLTTIIIPSEKYPRGFEGGSLDPGLIAELKATGATACVWALGTSQTKVSKDDYYKITHDYAMTAARALSTLPSTPEKPFRFIFMSGGGADQTEKSWTLYCRVKGKTEKDLAALETDRFKVLSVRPGGIIPMDNHRKHLSYIENASTGPFARAIIGSLVPDLLIHSTGLAKACLRLATVPDVKQDPHGWGRRTDEGWLGNGVLRELAETPF